MLKESSLPLLNRSLLTKRVLKTLLLIFVSCTTQISTVRANNPAPPVLNAIAATTQTNPIGVSGTALANSQVHIYINDQLSHSFNSDGAGAFSGNVALVDGNNDIYAKVEDAGLLSLPSNTESTTYTNTIINRTFSNVTINTDTVWTAGGTPSPYMVSGGLTIAAGSTLTVGSTAQLQVTSGILTISDGARLIVKNDAQLQLHDELTVSKGGQLVIEDGVNVAFHNNNWLRIQGDVEVKGSAGNEVMFTSGQLNPQQEDWQGLYIDASLSSDGNVVIEHAIIEYATTGLNFYRSGSRGNITHTHIRYTTSGVKLHSHDSVFHGAYNPLPVITDSRFSSNTKHVEVTNTYYMANEQLINMRRNWWGSVDLGVIDDLIDDQSDGFAKRALVDIQDLTDEAGLPVYTQGSTRVGAVNDTDSALVSGQSYYLLGRSRVLNGQSWTLVAGALLTDEHGASDIIVDNGATLQIAVNANYPNLSTTHFSVAGTMDIASNAILHSRGVEINDNGILTLRSGSELHLNGDFRIAKGGQLLIEAGVKVVFHSNHQMQMLGDVSVQGGAGNEVEFTSAQVAPQAGDWKGLYIDASLSSDGNVVIEHAIIEYATTGLEFFRSSTRGIITNTHIRNNTSGVKLHSHNSTFYGPYNPLPTITDNRLYNNTKHVEVSNNYYMAHEQIIDMRRNWWGTVDISAIHALIDDQSDGFTDKALVDIRDFVDEAGLPYLPSGSMLTGAVNDTDTALLNGQSYYLVGQLRVLNPTSWSLTNGANLISTSGSGDIVVDAGGNLQVANNASYTGLSTSRFVVNGTMEVGSNAVLHTSGININNGGVLTLRSGSQLHLYGETAVAKGGQLLIEAGVQVVYHSNDQLIINGDFSAQGTLGNEVVFSSSQLNPQPGDWQGLYIDNNVLSDGNVVIDHAIIEYAQRALVFYQSGTRGVITHTQLRYNITAVNLSSQYSSASEIHNPVPIITDGSLHDNAKHVVVDNNYYNASNYSIDMRRNWWGTADVNDIEALIDDRYDGLTRRAVVDISGYYNHKTGTPTSTQLLTGTLTTNTTLNHLTRYVLWSDYTVATGVTLTIPAGTQIESATNATLIVDGTLLVNGSENNWVTFSVDTLAGTADWQGILVNTGGNITVEHAVIEHAVRGVEFNQTNNLGTVRHSLIHKNSTGIYLHKNASPLLEENRIVYNTQHGLFLNGTNSTDASSPQPTVTNNDIYANKVHCENYGTSSIQLDMSNNWWGVVSPQHIDVIAGDSAAVVSITLTPVAAPLQAPYLVSATLNYDYVSPNSDTVQDSAVISGTLTEASDWQLQVYEAINNTLVYTATGTGSGATSISWAGLDQTSATVADGFYRIVITTTAGTRTGLAAKHYVTIDNTAPIATINTPLNNAVLQNAITLAVLGDAADTHFLHYRLEQGSGATPTVWSPIGSTSNNPVNDNELGAWVVGSTTGETPAINGNYTIALRVTDKAGNHSEDTVLFTLDNITFDNVSATSSNVDLDQSESLNVNLSLNLPGTITLKIYSDQDDTTVVRTLTFPLAAGSHTVTWDGLDENSEFVPGGGYFYTLKASDGTRIGDYQLVNNAPLVAINACENGCAYNTFTNDSYKTTVTLTEPTRVYFAVELNDVKTYPYGDDNGRGFILQAGTHTLRWDGINLLGGGMHVNNNNTTIHLNTQLLANNEFAVINSATDLEINGQAIWVDVKTDPYLIYLSYGQFTNIVYNLKTPPGHDAMVEIKLLPPGISDYNHPDAIVVTQQTQSSGDHSVTWTGVDTTDNNELKRTMGNMEGPYSFAIKASANNVETLYRGVLNAYQ